MDSLGRLWLGLVGGIVTLVLAFAAACGGSSAPDPSGHGPTTAELWFAAYRDAQRQGAVNLSQFLDPDVVIDQRGLLGLRKHEAVIVAGRDAAVAYLGRQWSLARRVRTTAAPIYLSQVGAVDLGLIAIPGDHGFHGVFVEKFGADGIASERYAGSELSWREGSVNDARRLDMQVRARDYLAAWASANGSAVRELYASDATATDDLAAVQALGAAQIGALAEAGVAAGALPGVTLDSLPNFGGPADFAAGRPTSAENPPPLETQVMLVTVDDGTGCPGHLAIVLDLDAQGQIVAEHRHHRADDLMRCAGGALPAGWWEEVTVPPAVTIELTDTLDVKGHKVQIFNGTEGLSGLVEWAFGRFTAAGLPAPAVDSVTFLKRSADRCRAFSGLIAGREVTLCFQSAICANDACDQWTDAARTIALHELAHAWIDEHVGTDTRRAFLELAGLESWASSDVAWGDRGVELAASTMAWGLLDVESSVNPKLGPRACAELAELFSLLVEEGTKPHPTCSPRREDRATPTRAGPRGDSRPGRRSAASPSPSHPAGRASVGALDLGHGDEHS